MNPHQTLLSLVTALLCGCSGSADVRIGFGLSQEDEARATPGGDPGPKPGLTLTTAELMVRDLELGGHPGKKDKHKKVWQTIDLLDPAASDINMLDVEPGVYHRLSLRIRAADGASVFMSGLIDGVPFEFRDDSRFTVTLLSEDGILVEEGHVAELFVEFDAEEWFTDVDFAALVTSPDGIIYIDETHNVKAWETLRDALQASIELVDDRGQAR